MIPKPLAYFELAFAGCGFVLAFVLESWIYFLIGLFFLVLGLSWLLRWRSWP